MLQTTQSREKVNAVGLPPPLSFVVPATAAPADAGVVVAVGVMTATLVGVCALTAAAAAAGGGDGCGCGYAGELAATGGSAGAGDVPAMMSIGFSQSRRVSLSSLCNSEHSTAFTLRMLSFPRLTALLPK